MEFIRKTQFIFGGVRNYTKRKHPFVPLENRLDGKVVVITGATAGIGLGMAMDFAKRGAEVHILARDLEKAEKVRKQIAAESKSEKIRIHRCDMSVMKDIKSFAKDFTATYKELHILVNNAGVMLNTKETTAENIEKNFATNTLGVYLLTKELLPVLKSTQPSSKVINVSSGGMLTQKLDIEGDYFMEKQTFDGTKQYAINKRQMVAMTEYFARKFTKDHVFFYSMHPGWVDTEGVRQSMPDFHKRFEKDLRGIAEGIDTVTYLAVTDDSKLIPGEFYFDREVESKHLTFSLTTYSEKQVEQLVNDLENMLKKIGV